MVKLRTTYGGSMIEVLCDNCQCHVCWMTDCGPRGTIYCDECYEEERVSNGQ